MQIENSFPVKASPDRVYEFLLDVNHVAGCVPGAELSEVVDPDTFKGKVRIKVGPVTVRYNGIARITARDPASRSATLEAEGRETTGSGSAQATTTMSVIADGQGSTVTLATDFTVVGRVAQFGRGIMEDVSRLLVGQMAECIRATLEAPERGAAGSQGTGGPAAGTDGSQAAGADAAAVAADDSPGEVGTSARPKMPIDEPFQAAEPLDAFALGRALARDRVSRLRAEKVVPVVFGVLLAVLALRRLRRAIGG